MKTHPNPRPFSPPFGMLVQERVYTAVEYRFGFNGKEKDDEVSGGGNTLAFEARIYDSRLGRFFSTDPLEFAFSWQSTYVFAANNPIALIDYLGMSAGEPNEPDHDTKRTTAATDDNGSIIDCVEYYDHFGGKGWIDELPNKTLDVAIVRSPPKIFDERSWWQRNKKATKAILSVGLDFIPVIGQIKGLAEVIVGKDIITGDELTAVDRGLGLIPYAGKVGKALSVNKALKSANAANALNDAKKANKSFRKGNEAKKVDQIIEDIPTLDKTGKLHGDLPKRKEWKKYSGDDLKKLESDIKHSIKQRSYVNKTHPDKDKLPPHTRRLNEEIDLLRDIQHFMYGK